MKTTSVSTMFLLVLMVLSGLTCSTTHSVEAATMARPVIVGLTAEYGLRNSYSAQAVEMGIRIAMDEINSHGGVLENRPLELMTRDDRSVPSRAIDNVREFADNKDVVAVFGARFSPVLLELLPVVHERQIILLDPWASANGITDNAYSPSFSFRLSLKDSYAMPAMLSYAAGQGHRRVGLLLPNTGWGRSNESAARAYIASHPEMTLVQTDWYNWGDTTMREQYTSLLAAGVEVLALVANDTEGAILVNEMAGRPPSERLPIVSHWGVTGGRFFQNTQTSLHELDFAVVQSFSFFTAPPAARDRFMAASRTSYKLQSWESIEAPVGVAHAYDLTHLLAQAINKAGSTDRNAVREALENLGPYSGLTGTFDRPFTSRNHDALREDCAFMAKYDKRGFIIPAQLIPATTSK